MNKLLLATSIFISSFFVSGQTDCPLNTSEFPFTTDDDWALYSWSAGLYMPFQLGGAQTLTTLSFRLDNHSPFGSYTYNNIRIYMRHTSVNNYSSSPGYPGTAGFTQVWSGNMTFSSTGVYTFVLSTGFVYDGIQNLELLIENRGGSDNTDEEPWFDRTNNAGSGVYSGKVGWGSSWSSATSSSQNRTYNLQINSVDCGGFPLPVKLKDVTAVCENDNKTILRWTTFSESNNDYFSIERSVDGISWREVGRVEGSGTTNNSNTYEFEDVSDDEEIMYYKLSQTDFNGEGEMLRVVTVNCAREERLFAYLNTSDHTLVVDSDEISGVKIINSTGQQVELSAVDTGDQVVFEVSSLPKGLYIICVTEEGSQKMQKVIIF